MKTIVTSTHENRLASQGWVDLNLHLDHLCSAGEEVFLTLPWTDCVTRYGMMVKHSVFAKNTIDGNRVRNLKPVPESRKTA